MCIMYLSNVELDIDLSTYPMFHNISIPALIVTLWLLSIFMLYNLCRPLAIVNVGTIS